MPFFFLLLIVYSLQKVKMVKLEVNIVHIKRNQLTSNKHAVRLSLDS